MSLKINQEDTLIIWNMNFLYYYYQNMFRTEFRQVILRLEGIF